MNATSDAMMAPQGAGAGRIVLSLVDEKGHGCESQAWSLAGKNTYTLGRASTNDVPLAFSWVSRKHAIIQVEENGTPNLIDLGSANGTFVNGRRIYTPTQLRPDDLIGIGKTVLRFSQSGGVQAPVIDEEEAERTVAFAEKEMVTVLICDIHDFTRLSERIGDQQVSKLLRFWSGKVSELVRRYEGIVDKFIGDAVMAMWAGGADARRTIFQALHTALAIDEVTRQIGIQWPDLPWELEIGAALNTGEAMVGNIGGDGRRDFTVIGDVVNVAFRLEGMTSKEEGVDCIMGGQTAAYLPDVERFFAARRYTLRGKQGPILSHVSSFEGLRAYLRHCKAL